MCGMDVDLDDGGPGEEEEKEEEFWVGEGVKMLPPPVAHSGGSAWGSRRDRCGCVACGAVLVLWNLCAMLACALLLALVFSLVLLPALVLLYIGFLCHSRQVLDAPSAICRYLDDNSCSALIILGFVMMSPLVMVAAAVFCGLLRRFRLLLLIQPLTRAWYRGRLLDWVGGVHAWI
uniref:Transmembrane protein 88B n=1 Tax=Mola mola TaxID=94237 RepID=A0A3Q3XCM4_MOLML